MIGRRQGLRLGRFAEQGLTLRSAAVTVVVVVAVMVGLGWVAAQFQTEYPFTPTILATEVIEDDDGCHWAVELSFRNDADRTLRLVSVAIAGVDDSARGMLGPVDPGESIERTYRYPVADCQPPPAERLVVRYGPSLSTKVRSTTVDLEPEA